MEISKNVGDAGRCSKQSNKRSYGAKKKRFAGSKPKQLLSQLKKRVKRRKTSNVEGYRLLDVKF